MYTLINRSACQVHPQLVLDANAEEHLLIIIKSSFHIDGEHLSSTPATIVLADRYHGDPLRTSLAAAGEVVLRKPRPDLLLSGNAYPAVPGDHTGFVAFRVGPSWSKDAMVLGDRIWTRGLTGLRPGSPQPFDAIPLRYERAYGGADLDADPPVGSLANPVGVGQLRPSEGAPVPNLEHPRQLLGGPRDRPPPRGFGPIPPHWAPRVSLHGTLDADWRRTRMPLAPLDADPRAAQCAPPDQVYPGPLHGDEEVEIRGVRPGGLTLKFRLPGIRVRVTVHDGHSPVVVPSVLDTLHVDAEVPRLDLTWRTSISVHERLDALEWVLIETTTGGSHG